MRLPRDHYIRLDSNDYSVHPSVIGRRIEVIADLERVRALREGTIVADHERIWAAHQTISDPEHVEAASAAAHQGRPAATGARAGGADPVPG
jgi:transposase